MSQRAAAGADVRFLKNPLRWVLGALMVFAGVMHFTKTDTFARIVPRFLPYHSALVLISGVFEIALGVGLQITRLRRISALGLIALFVAVFPANINMAVQNMPIGGRHLPLLLWLRLPLQLVLIAWAWWYARAGSERGEPA